VYFVHAAFQACTIWIELELNIQLSTALLQVGWVTMVKDLSFVLYSRLHLLKPSKTTLRVVLALIIVDAFLFHGPVIISTIFGNVYFFEIRQTGYSFRI
jgi:hypothetical protein